MKLKDLFRHNVRIEFVDGNFIEGYVHTYITAADNDPDPESIIIDCYEITINDIKSATILDYRP